MVSLKKKRGWQNIDLTTLTRWHTDTGGKFILTAACWNDTTDLQMTYLLSLVGTLRARSNTSDWGGLCKGLQQSFQEKSEWH